MATSKLHRWADIEPEQMNAQITRQYVVGTNTMLARLVLKKGGHVPLHPLIPKHFQWWWEMKYYMRGEPNEPTAQVHYI